MHTSSDSLTTQAVTPAYARSEPHASRRRLSKRRVFGGLAVIAAIVIVAGATAPKWLGSLTGGEQDFSAYHVVEPVDLVITLTEDGELKPRESVKIKCEVEVQSTILFVVEESTKVKEGDLLVELTSDTLKERLRSKDMELESIQADYQASEKELELQKSQNASNIKKAQIDLEVAKLNLEKYVNGDYISKLEQIKLRIRQSEEEIKRKKVDLEEKIELEDKGWVNKKDVEDLKFALTVANWQLAQHRLSEDILDKYEKPKMMTQYQSAVERAREEHGRERDRAETRVGRLQARVKQYKAQLSGIKDTCAKLREQIEQCKMFAPSDGVVQYPSEGWWRSNNRISVGERVHKGQTLLELPDTSQMLVKTRVHEADRHMIQEGLPCVVKVTAAPGKTFAGKISKIDKFVDTENRWLNPNLKEHGAEILLDPTDVTLAPGESAQVKILIDTLEGVLATPVQCVFTRGSRSFVFAENGGAPEYVEVKIGRSSNSMVEIVEGVNSGDRVLMDVNEQQLTTLPADTDESGAIAEQLAIAKAAAEREHEDVSEATDAAPEATVAVSTVDSADKPSESAKQDETSKETVAGEEDSATEKTSTGSQAAAADGDTSTEGASD